MGKTNKLLFVMLDGISSAYFMSFPQHLPHLHAVASTGLLITDLAPAQCASSLPGRASIITGVPALQHGIYGNKIWDAGRRCFRDPCPADVRVPSLFRQTKEVGMDTACVGFGMVDPEDCTLYEPPFWVREYIDRSPQFRLGHAGRNRIDAPQIGADWNSAGAVKDDGRLADCKGHAGIAAARIADLPKHAESHGLGQDRQMLALALELLKCDDSPQVLFTEFNFTDAVQHDFGYASKRSHAAMQQADRMVAELLDALKRNGKYDQFHIVITSDHGHHNVERAIFPERIIDSAAWHGEGAILLVEKNSVDCARLAATLAPLGVCVHSGDFLPEDARDELLVLVASGYASFERGSPSLTSDTRPNHAPLLGKSAYASSHSYAPGIASDNRFAVLCGPSINPGVVRGCSLEGFHHHLQKILFE